MSNRDLSLDPKILESAKKEFLAKGFLDASLKAICDDADVTTGAVYRRYKGKEDLFVDVVKPAVDLFDSLMISGEDINQRRAEEDRLQDSWLNADEIVKYWINQIYKDRETVVILLSKADGTVYSNFVNDFIEKNFVMSYEFMKALEAQGRCNLRLSYIEFHVLLTSYWTALFELVIHDFSLSEALDFVPKITTFFAWDKLIEFS